MDTIVAISTSIGSGAISIVKISGEKSFNILKKIFIPKNLNEKLEEIDSHRLIYGNIFDGERYVDEVLVSFMRKPNTYTKEDLVEINCHGGDVVSKKIISLVIGLGARQALPGEFTKRAFINGRIDLTQAESVLDIISSNSEKNLDFCLKNMSGFLREKVLSIKKSILDSISEINVVSDYPEELEDNIDISSIKNLENISNDLEEIIESYSKGKKIRNGVKVALVGKPNVGKSSIMNRLLRSDRSIVTSEEGTTRDVLEDTFYVNGYPVVLLDTAGIRESKNKVEKIGIELSKRAIEESDLVILVLDKSTTLDDKDRENIRKIEKKNYLIVSNKEDLEERTSLKDIEKELKIYEEDRVIEISSLKDSTKELEDKIFNLTYESEIEDSYTNLVLTNIRHRDLFVKVKESMDKFLLEYKKIPLDISSIYLSNALRYLGEIIGEISNEDMLDNIFSNFCVGK